MHSAAQIAQIFSLVSFGAYGAGCILSKRMVGEFERYRMPSYRVLTGWLQMAASAGLALGFYVRPIALASSGGLALMMFVAVVVRFKIQDSWVAALPAFSFCLLNLYIFLQNYEACGF